MKVLLALETMQKLLIMTTSWMFINYLIQSQIHLNFILRPLIILMLLQKPVRVVIDRGVGNLPDAMDQHAKIPRPLPQQKRLFELRVKSEGEHLRSPGDEMCPAKG